MKTCERMTQKKLTVFIKRNLMSNNTFEIVHFFYVWTLRGYVET